MKNILVLGGTGFVGTHVCEKLVRAGYTLTLPTRRRSHACKVQHLPGLKVLEMDVHQPAALAQALQGQDAVVNLVAILHGTQAAFDKVHVELPQSLARGCQQADVRNLVHISALGVNGAQPAAAPSMYLRSKGQGEAVLAAFASTTGARVSLLRPSVIFGREDKFLNLFARLQRIAPCVPLAGAEARFQPVWVEDVAQAVLHCLVGNAGLQGRLGSAARPPGVVDIFEAVGPQIFTLKQLVQTAGRLAGVQGGQGRVVFGLPAWAGHVQARFMESLPGVPLMSRDNLASMQVDNVATGQLPGLADLGIQAAALEPVARTYLASGLR